MKLIFLDIDGVLNNEVHYSKEAHEQRFKEPGEVHDIDRHNVELLNELVANTGARIVISSTWRYGRTTAELQKILEDFGFKGEIIGVTPSLRFPGALRGNEIYRWLEENTAVYGSPSSDFREYIILDDDSDMLLWQANNFICVDSYTGLTPRNIYKAQRILEGKA